MDNRSLSHTRWKYQYHIVFVCVKSSLAILSGSVFHVKKGNSNQLRDDASHQILSLIGIPFYIKDLLISFNLNLRRKSFALE